MANITVNVDTKGASIEELETQAQAAIQELQKAIEQRRQEIEEEAKAKIASAYQAIAKASGIPLESNNDLAVYIWRTVSTRTKNRLAAGETAAPRVRTARTSNLVTDPDQKEIDWLLKNHNGKDAKEIPVFPKGMKNAGKKIHGLTLRKIRGLPIGRQKT